MVLADLTFPLYVLPQEADIEEIDGILFADGKCLDDKNTEGETLGLRRLRTPYPNVYPLKKAVHDIPSLLKSSSKRFINSEGEVFSYEKTRMVPLRYHLIYKVQNRDIVSLVWIEDINFPFEVPRPPSPLMRWAGILYEKNYPWLLYEFSEEWKKDSKRKI
jgi:hypothetical protein|tara:strand:+ start:394 stop:876 length:483 start_codon:yes stop_codon:yes gene_type:complete